MAGYYARQGVKRQIRARGEYWLTFALAKGHHSNGSSAARRAAETSSLRRQRHRRSFTSARGCFAKLWGVDRATLCAGSLILSDTASACDDYLFDRDVICLMFACSRSMGRASCDDGQRGGGTPQNSLAFAYPSAPPPSYAQADQRGLRGWRRSGKWGDLQPVQGTDPQAHFQIGFVLYDETALCDVWVRDP
jgi:hypothetical protein